MAITAGVYRVLRNGVEISSGTFLGSSTFSYTPPDGNPANYEVQFRLPGGTGFIYRRSIQVTAQKR